MIPFEEALHIVLEHVSPLGVERVPLEEAPGRFLAEDVVADTDMPRFHNSSVDGYGVRAADIEEASGNNPVCLPVAGVVPAGKAWTSGLPPGAALKIMTGAVVPEGVDTCVKREHTVESEGQVTFSRPAKRGDNIRPRGAEYLAGTTILPKGAHATPPVVAVLASLGWPAVEVYRRPRVRLLVTGTELAASGEALAHGQIYDSNGVGLEAAVRAVGITDVCTSTCEDDAVKIRAAIEGALGDADVVVTSGGVSVGDFDFIPLAFEGLGGMRRFWKVAIKPGKPNYFGAWEGRGSRSLFFGLPGNPVGALLSFERLVRPALLRLMGARDEAPQRFRATLSSSLEKTRGRMEWVRGVLAPEGPGLTVSPIAHRESHMLTGLARANCLICFPAEATDLAEGDSVEVQLLRWGL